MVAAFKADHPQRGFLVAILGSPLSPTPNFEWLL
jgi:hypothetical protein